MITQRTRTKKRHLGLRFVIISFVFVSLAAVAALAFLAIHGALNRRGLTLRSLAQGVSAYYARARAVILPDIHSAAESLSTLRIPEAASKYLKQEQKGAVRRVSISPSAYSHDEFCAQPSGTMSANDGGRPPSTFDLVNEWPADRRASLISLAPCTWALHQHVSIKLPPIPLCGTFS